MSTQEQAPAALGRLRRLVAAPARLLAPGWLRRAAAPAQARGPLPVERAVRTVIAVTTPLGLGLAFGALSLTVLIGIGAMIGSVIDRDVPYRQRVVRIGGCVLAGATGWMIGRTVQHGASVPVAVAVVAAVAAIASLLSGAGTVASLAGLQLLLMTTISSGRPFPGPVWQPGLLYLAGGAWALALSLAFGLGRRTIPERRSVAGVYDALADQLAANEDPAAAADRRAGATTALSGAYDVLLGARFRHSGHDPAFRRLFAVLNAATRVAEAATALQRERERPDDDVIVSLRGVAEAVRSGRTPPEVPRRDATTSVARRHLRDALDAVRRILAGEEEDRPWRPPSPRERLAQLRERLVPGAAGGRAAARLVLCMVAAEIVAHLDTTQRSYWVPLTVAIVLKPDLGSVFARGIQRGAGTVVGVLLGGLVIEFVPVGPWMLLFIALFAAIIPLGQTLNYGAFSTFLTPLILVLIDLISHLGTSLVVDRMIDSLIGVGIVLLLGYVLWPESWHARLGERVAAAVEGLRTYSDEVLRSPDAGRAAARRRAYRRLADLRTAFQQAMTEPGRVGRQALAWWPAVIGLERTTDAVTWTAAAVATGAAPPGRHDLDTLGAAVDDLADAVRRGRPPGDTPLPGTGPLRGVTDELATVRATLGGPDAGGGVGRGVTSAPPGRQVVDVHGGALAGVVVTATDPDGVQVARLSSDAEGRYAMPAGDVRLLVLTLPGHQPVARWIVPGARDPEAPVVLRAKPE